MLRSFFRAGVLCVISGALAAAPALADVTGPYGTVVRSANTAIKNALNAQAAKKNTQSLPPGTVAQVPPVGQVPVGGKAEIGLPTGFTYTVDFSFAHPYGNIGSFGNKWMQGGTDLVAGWGFSPKMSVIANYYELQHYPVGFNSGQVPFFLPNGFPPTPGVNPSCVDLSGATSSTCTGISAPVDVTTKDKFFLGLWENLINVGKFRGRSIPIVVTPTYVSRWSQVNASGNNGDVVPFVDFNGVPHFGISTRTTQVYSLAVTIPFLKTPRMFGTFTVAPSWLVHTAGLNQQNHVQLYQILYLEYNPTPSTKIFLEPQSSRDYLPADPYAQHVAAYFAGIAQRLGPMAFVQLVLNSGGPTNYTPYGIKQLNCLQLPCSANTVPTVGGLKATQLQIQIGIGSPSVIQF
jgi:hypothetical protein